MKTTSLLFILFISCNTQSEKVYTHEQYDSIMVELMLKKQTLTEEYTRNKKHEDLNSLNFIRAKIDSVAIERAKHL